MFIIHKITKILNHIKFKESKSGINLGIILFNIHEIFLHFLYNYTENLNTFEIT